MAMDKEFASLVFCERALAAARISANPDHPEDT
jgi:hypothetical protein